jgi:hypothetical protein
MSSTRSPRLEGVPCNTTLRTKARSPRPEGVPCKTTLGIKARSPRLEGVPCKTTLGIKARSPRPEGVPCKTTLVCQDCNALFQDGNRIAVFWQPVHGIMERMRSKECYDNQTQNPPG